jgi:hypothetical protein
MADIPTKTYVHTQFLPSGYWNLSVIANIIFPYSVEQRSFERMPEAAPAGGYLVNDEKAIADQRG